MRDERGRDVRGECGGVCAEEEDGWGGTQKYPKKARLRNILVGTAFVCLFGRAQLLLSWFAPPGLVKLKGWNSWTGGRDGNGLGCQDRHVIPSWELGGV